MRSKALSLISTLPCIALLFVTVSLADIPAPPVNQSLGFPDTIFNNLVEAECRECHDDPVVVGPTPNMDRHHLLYGSPLTKGICSSVRGNCDVSGDACADDDDCPAGETCIINYCLSDDDCDPDICNRAPEESCAVDTDCDQFALGETCGEICIGETVVPNLDTNQDGAFDTVYACVSCHPDDPATPDIVDFFIIEDCTQCHVQISGEGSVHHLMPVAQGLDSPLGNPLVGDCTPCHGTIVDDIGDGHTIPTYDPSLVTPSPDEGEGLPLNSRGNGAGACDYCHDSGLEAISDVEVFTNSDNHHNTGVYRSETGATNNDACMWCHNFVEPIRGCEGCHGYESLHNIQDDSDGDCCVTVGAELFGYGHVGADNPGTGSDCWGCHGFSFGSASAPGSGPTVPFINTSEDLVIVAGTDTAVTLSGSSFTSTIGAFVWTSSIVLTADDGSTITLTPDTIDTCSCTVTIPGTTAVGNYTLQAAKGDALSNPVALSVKPPVEIDTVTCKSTCAGTTMTITGVGFGEAPPDGAEDYINVIVDGGVGNVLSWSEEAITLTGCGDVITVNALYGSATYQL